jgi:hypothetical protein
LIVTGAYFCNIGFVIAMLPVKKTVLGHRMIIDGMTA